MTVLLEGICKKYSRNLKTSLKYGLRDALKAGAGRADRSTLRTGEFWALRDIDMRIEPGERIGVIGRNGAGKSTLSKLICGISLPDRGKLTVTGSVDQIIELTAGFHPNLTGRENARLHALIKGLTDAEFRSEIERIIEFSELETFIDSPTKFYSSGMKARLGFCVATMRKPDILIVDEALAVGDLRFRLKCYEFLEEYLKDTSLILVSHSLSQIARFCNRGVVLEKGRMIHDGGVEDAIDVYSELNSDNTKSSKDAVLNEERINFKLESGGVTINDGGSIRYGDALSVLLNIQDIPPGSQIFITLDNAHRKHVLEWHSSRSRYEYRGEELVSVNLGAMELNGGYYRMNVQAIAPNGHDLICYTPSLVFKVEGKLTGLADVQPNVLWQPTTQALAAPDQTYNTTEYEG